MTSLEKIESFSNLEVSDRVNSLTIDLNRAIDLYEEISSIRISLDKNRIFNLEISKVNVNRAKILVHIISDKD